MFTAMNPKFWLDEGNIVIWAPSEGFKVDKGLLYRNSPTLATLPKGDPNDYGLPPDCIVIPITHLAQAKDIEALLEHLYHDVPLEQDITFQRIASVLVASAPQALNMPKIYELSKKCVERLFPSDPEGYVHPENLEEALRLSHDYNIHAIKKSLYYSLMTTTSSLEVDESMDLAAATPSLGQLPLSDIQICARLMDQVMAHFTPMLFTPPGTQHMACTDVFAEHWMTLVIQPALESGGVYKPLETLQTIRAVDWGGVGLCSECVVDKREEWKQDQQDIWEKMDKWLARG